MAISRPLRISTVLCLVLGFVGCAQYERPGSKQSFMLDISDGMVSISVSEEGIPLEEFIRVAQPVTGKVFAYSRKDIAGDEHRIRFIGQVKVRREKFLKFFKTLLHVNAFSCVARGEGANQVFEITSI